MAWTVYGYISLENDDDEVDRLHEQLATHAETEGLTAFPLQRRTPAEGPIVPTEVFDDLAVLQRVADGLRALDWDLPDSPGGHAMR
jgi:hypothetical protein